MCLWRSSVLLFLIGCPVANPPAATTVEEPAPGRHEPWREGIASWYSRAECMTPSNPNALMANGQPLDDAALTCASWDYPFGTVLIVSSSDGSRSVTVTVTDRGPARRLYAQGRKLDLTRAAFSRLAHLDTGLVRMRYRRAEP